MSIRITSTTGTLIAISVFSLSPVLFLDVVPEQGHMIDTQSDDLPSHHRLDDCTPRVRAVLRRVLPSPISPRSGDSPQGCDVCADPSPRPFHALGMAAIGAAVLFPIPPHGSGSFPLLI